MVCRMRERGTDSTSPSIWRTAGEPGGEGAAVGPPGPSILLGAGLGRVPAATSASMSSLVMRPSGPLPRTAVRSMACSAASFRASGETFKRSAASPGAGAFTTAGRNGLGGAAAGAGLGGAVGAAGRGWTFCPGAPISAMLAPTAALFPSSTRIWSKTPASSASMSTLTLSVSISAMGSPLATGSPGRFFHFSTFPSVIASPIFGMMTSATGGPPHDGTKQPGDQGTTPACDVCMVPWLPGPMVPLSGSSERLLHGRGNVRLVWHRPHFERAGVGHGDVGPGDALDRRVQLIECVFIDTHRNLGSGSEWLPLFLDHHCPMRARDRLHDGRRVERSQAPHVDDLGLDALCGELFRRRQGRKHHPAVGDDGDVSAAPRHRGLPKGQGEVRVGYLTLHAV